MEPQSPIAMLYATSSSVTDLSLRVASRDHSHDSVCPRARRPAPPDWAHCNSQSTAGRCSVGSDVCRRQIAHCRVYVCAAVWFLCIGIQVHSATAAPDGEYLTLERVDVAIAKAIRAYYEKIEPVWTFDRSYHLEKRFHFNNWQVEHVMGNHALMIWAAIACGESYQNPILYRRINWVLSLDYPYTYDRSMRLQMLGQLPLARWGPWVRRDGVMISKSLTMSDEAAGIPGGSFAAQYTDGQVQGWGDAANTQYGTLGIAAANKAGVHVRKEVWALIDRNWRLTQHKPSRSESVRHRGFGVVNPAGWSVVPLASAAPGLNKFYQQVSGPMTAGAVTSLCLSERYLRGEDLNLGEGLSLSLRRGIAWLDTQFTLSDAGEQADWYYYMYHIQNVGRATGYRTFNGVNWHRQVTAQLLSRQNEDGFWSGPKGKLLSTGFALLYLSQVKNPVAISKIRWKRKVDAVTGKAFRKNQSFVNMAVDGHKQLDPRGGGQDWIEVDGAWNNFPHDIWNFVDYVSDQYEVETTWQIVELDQPVHELIESPILYLATDKAFDFSDAQVSNLRQYIEAGGLLVTNSQGPHRSQAVHSIRALAQRLFNGKPWQKVSSQHAFYRLHQPVSLNLSMQMIDNGLRPLIVHLDRDISNELQRRDTDTDAFKVLSNIYLYVTGMSPRRPRLSNNHVVQVVSDPAKQLLAARVRHSGVFDPEPNALMQLKAVLANDYHVDLAYEPVGISAMQLEAHKLAFLTTAGDGALTQSEAQALRRWVEAGGTLWIDAAGGSAEASHRAQEMFATIVPAMAPVPLPRDHPIIAGYSEIGRGLSAGGTARYRNYALRAMGPTRDARVFAHMINGRAAILLTSEDVTCGLAGLDHWGIFGYMPSSARKLVAHAAWVVAQNSWPSVTPTAEGG